MTTTSGPARSRLDPEPMPRRDFLGLASVWAAGTTLAFAAVGMLRLPRAAVLASPSRKFRVRLPETLAPGEAFVPPGRAVAIFRDAGGVYAISQVCTHLGCIVKTEASGFHCPCHGSRFKSDGSVEKGPGPAALPWRKVTLDGETCVVDEDVTVPPGTRAQA